MSPSSVDKLSSLYVEKIKIKWLFYELMKKDIYRFRYRDSEDIYAALRDEIRSLTA